MTIWNPSFGDPDKHSSRCAGECIMVEDVFKDWRVYDVAMTAEQIAAEYEAFVRLGDDWMIEGETIQRKY